MRTSQADSSHAASKAVAPSGGAAGRVEIAPSASLFGAATAVDHGRQARIAGSSIAARAHAANAGKCFRLLGGVQYHGAVKLFIGNRHNRAVKTDAQGRLHAARALCLGRRLLLR